MKSLIITDLARTEELDRGAMASVRGGWSMYSPGGAPSCTMGDVTYAPSHDSSISATQNLFKNQGVATLTANDAAFVEGIDVHGDVSQRADNKIVRR